MKEKLNLRDTLNIDNDITFGIEIEFGKANYEKAKKSIYKLDRTGIISTTSKGSESDIKVYSHWATHPDWTVTQVKFNHNVGGEVVSPIMTDNKNSYNDILKLTKKLLIYERNRRK